MKERQSDGPFWDLVDTVELSADIPSLVAAMDNQERVHTIPEGHTASTASRLEAQTAAANRAIVEVFKMELDYQMN